MLIGGIRYGLGFCGSGGGLLNCGKKGIKWGIGFCGWIRVLLFLLI